MERTLLTLKEVLELVLVKRSTWYAGIKEGAYPKPVKIGKRKVAWRQEDIKKHIESLGY